MPYTYASDIVVRPQVWANRMRREDLPQDIIDKFAVYGLTIISDVLVDIIDLDTKECTYEMPKNIRIMYRVTSQEHRPSHPVINSWRMWIYDVAAETICWDSTEAIPTEKLAIPVSDWEKELALELLSIAI